LNGFFYILKFRLNHGKVREKLINAEILYQAKNYQIACSVVVQILK